MCEDWNGRKGHANDCLMSTIGTRNGNESRMGMPLGVGWVGIAKALEWMGLGLSLGGYHMADRF